MNNDWRKSSQVTFATVPAGRTDAGQLGTVQRADDGTGELEQAVIMQTGPLTAGDWRPFYVDKKSIEQAFALIKDGIRARLTHDGQVGQYLGRWDGIEMRDRPGDADTFELIGTLRIGATATKARGPATDDSSLADYVLTMLDEDPTAAGFSVASTLDIDAMIDAERPDGLFPMRFEAITAADLVDTAAATHTGVFSASAKKRGDPMKVSVKVINGELRVVVDGEELQPQTNAAELFSVDNMRALNPGGVEGIEAAAEEAQLGRIAGRFEAVESATGAEAVQIINGELTAEQLTARQLREQNEQLRAELAASREAGANSGPGFASADNTGGGSAGDAGATTEDTVDATLRSEWEANKGGVQGQFSTFGAFRGYRVAKAAGLTR